MLILRLLPTGFNYPGDLAAGGKLSQADSAHVKFSVIGSGPAAQWAAVVFPNLKFASSLRFDDH
jgi:hypothetical protein